MAKLLAIVIGFLVLIQGGFFIRTSLFALIALSGMVLFQWKKGERKISWDKKENVIIIFCIGFLLSYLVAGIAHEFSEMVISRIVLILLMYVGRIYVKQMQDKEKNQVVSALMIVGGIEWFILILGMENIKLPLNDILVNHRFMGTFQYANAMSLWFGMILLVEEYSEKGRWSWLRLPVLVTMSLTWSVGGFICYGFGMLLLPTQKEKKNKIYVWADRFCEYGVGILLGACIYLLQYRVQMQLVSTIIMLLTPVIGFFYNKIRNWCRNKLQVIMIALVLLGAALLLYYVAGERAVGTFIERLVQMRDGFYVIRGHIWTGIGDSFAKYAQTRLQANYHVSLVHNSFIQFGVEAGIGALLCSIGFFVTILSKEKINLEKTLLIILLLHSIFDFSMMFTALIVTGFAFFVEKE